MSEALDMLHDSICDHLERIRRYFKIPVKLTIFVRAVGQADSTHDVFVSEDDVETAIAAIRRLHADPTASATGRTTTREEVFDALREGAAAIERSGQKP